MLTLPIDCVLSLEARDVSIVVNRHHGHRFGCPGNRRVTRRDGREPSLDGNNLQMTFRILGPHERGRFAPDAWGQLLALSRTGAVSSSELEQLIERALVQIDGRIALDDLRALEEAAGISEPASETKETVH